MVPPAWRSGCALHSKRKAGLSDLCFRVYGLGFRVLRFRVQGFGFRGMGLGLRIQGLGLGFRVSGGFLFRETVFWSLKGFGF